MVNYYIDNETGSQLYFIISRLEIAEKSGFTNQTKEEILEESKSLLNRNL